MNWHPFWVYLLLFLKMLAFGFTSMILGFLLLFISYGYLVITFGVVIVFTREEVEMVLLGFTLLSGAFLFLYFKVFQQ